MSRTVGVKVSHQEHFLFAFHQETFKLGIFKICDGMMEKLLYQESIHAAYFPFSITFLWWMVLAGFSFERLSTGFCSQVPHSLMPEVLLVLLTLNCRTLNALNSRHMMPRTMCCDSICMVAEVWCCSEHHLWLFDGGLLVEAYTAMYCYRAVISEVAKTT